ncbi:MAG TPA: LptF/LptG family permease [bacterium]|nr:LptF/LptG family permease [bacterium]
MSLGRRSTTLDLYLIASFIPVFFVSLLFFVLLVEMADLFVNIVQYVQNEAPIASVARSMVLYLPKCVSWSLPMATLFSVSYILGTMYTNNELAMVFGSGVPLFSFIMPLILTAVLLSGLFLAFDDMVVLPTMAAKKELSRSLFKISEPIGSANVTILGSNRRFVWNMKYYDRRNLIMTGVILVERDTGGHLVSRLNAQSASWNGARWVFNGVRRFYWKGDSLVDASYGTWDDAELAEPPDSFKGGGRPIEEMSLSDARAQLALMKRSGLPSSGQIAEYYRRFAFALTPLIVTLLSAALAGFYKKNVLLMSLLVSLIAATLYYVTQMVSMLLAKTGSIDPFAGAFSPLTIFMIIVVVLFRVRKA